MQELKTVFERIGKPLSDDQVNNLMNQLDSDRNGSISFVEFLRGYNWLEKLSGNIDFSFFMILL